MKIKLITLHVENMENSLKFYQDTLGLEIVAKRNLPNMELVFLGTDGDIQIELICAELENYTKQNSSTIHFGIECKNIEVLVSEIKNNGYIVNGPISPVPNNPSILFYLVHDSDGFVIQLIKA